MLHSKQRIRLRYAKEGDLRFLSQVDTARTMKAAINRAGLPAYYKTFGTPKPAISLCPPPPIGAASRCELIDIIFTQKVNCKNLPDRLNASLPKGLHILAAYPAKTSLREIAWAEYELKFNAAVPPEGLTAQTPAPEVQPKVSEKQPDVLTNQLEGVFSSPLIIKKNKGYKRIKFDIAGHCQLKKAEMKDGLLSLQLLLSVKPGEFVSPVLLVDTLLHRFPALSEIDDRSMIRKKFRREDGKEFH